MTLNSVHLRWFFDRPVFVQYYNVTYRWKDQIGFSITLLPGSQLDWPVYGLMSGGTYTFRVIAATPWNSAFSEIKRTTGNLWIEKCKGGKKNVFFFAKRFCLFKQFDVKSITIRLMKVDVQFPVTYFFKTE